MTRHLLVWVGLWSAPALAAPDVTLAVSPFDDSSADAGLAPLSTGGPTYDTDLQGAAMSARLAMLTADPAELNAVRERWKARLDVANTARSRIDAAVAELSCSDVCPWP